MPFDAPLGRQFLYGSPRYAPLSMSVARNKSSDHGACVVDPHGREVRSIRISVTQRCDLACSHCHREGQEPARDEMTPEELERIVSLAASMGVRKVKLTGGEPLLRGDIIDIVSRIASAVSEVSMTTNGSFLEHLAGGLKDAGLRRVNVSLHSLDPDTYKGLCGVDIVDRVVRGVERAVAVGLDPVKVNMVVMKNLNEHEIPSMSEFCARVGAVLQLIEYMSDRAGENGCAFSERFYSLGPVEKALSDRAFEVSMNDLHRRKRYRVAENGREVTVEVVRPMHNTEFCSNCTRIRLSSDGKLKPCLLDGSGTVDLITPMRNGADDQEIERLFLKAVSNRKPYWS